MKIKDLRELEQLRRNFSSSHLEKSLPQKNKYTTTRMKRRNSDKNYLGKNYARKTNVKASRLKENVGFKV